MVLQDASVDGAEVGAELEVAVVVALTALGAAPAAQSQPQCFNETGYCIDEPAFTGYFNARGGARTLVDRHGRIAG